MLSTINCSKHYTFVRNYSKAAKAHQWWIEFSASCQYLKWTMVTFSTSERSCHKYWCKIKRNTGWLYLPLVLTISPCHSCTLHDCWIQRCEKLPHSTPALVLKCAKLCIIAVLHSNLLKYKLREFQYKCKAKKENQEGA
jgi:hypothetical protein